MDTYQTTESFTPNEATKSSKRQMSNKRWNDNENDAFNPFEPECLKFYHGFIEEKEVRFRLVSSSHKSCYLIVSESSENFNNFYKIYILHELQVKCIKIVRLMSSFYCEKKRFESIDKIIKHIIFSKLVSISNTAEFKSIPCSDLSTIFIKKINLYVCVHSISSNSDNEDLCVSMVGDIITLEDRISKDWVWCSNFTKKCAGMIPACNIMQINSNHIFPYYIDKMHEEDFNYYFMNQPTGTFFIQPESESGNLSLIIKSEGKEQFLKIDIKYYKDEYYFIGYMFHHLDEIIDFYIFRKKSFYNEMKPIDKKFLKLESVYSCLSKINSSHSKNRGPNITNGLNKVINDFDTNLTYGGFINCMNYDNKWNKYYFKLIISKKIVYFHKKPNSIKPMFILPLSQADIGIVDKSLFPDINFEIFYLLDLNDTYKKYLYFYVDENQTTRDTMDSFYAIIKNKSFLMEKLYQDMSFVELKQKISSNDLIKSTSDIQISLYNAELPTDISNRDEFIEAVIEIDGVPVAKTRNVFICNRTVTWNETFVISTSYNCSQVKIIISKISSNIHYECIIKRDSFKGIQENISGKKFQFNDTKEEGFIFLCVSLKKPKIILPRFVYSQFIKQILSPSLHNMLIVNDLFEDKIYFSDIIVKMLNKNNFDYIKRIIEYEINKYDDPRIFLSHNSIASCILISLLKLHGKHYLTTICSEFYSYCKNLNNFELDDTKVGKKDKLNENMIYLFRMLSIILNKIFQSIHLFPRIVSSLLTCFVNQIEQKWNKNYSIRKELISYIIFEQFICDELKNKNNKHKYFDYKIEYENFFTICYNVIINLCISNKFKFENPLYPCNVLLKYYEEKIKYFQSVILGEVIELKNYSEVYLLQEFDPYYLSNEINFIFQTCMKNYCALRNKTAKQTIFRSFIAALDAVWEGLQQYSIE